MRRANGPVLIFARVSKAGPEDECLICNVKPFIGPGVRVYWSATIDGYYCRRCVTRLAKVLATKPKSKAP